MITIQNAAMQVQISPFGAELQSVIMNGRERLWQGDPAVWSGRAPVLFPVAGGFLNDRYAWQDQTYQMPKHGFAKLRAFDILRQDERSVSLQLATREPNYPFDYRLIVTYALPTADTGALRVTYRVENHGDGDMMYGLGAHEGFSCPEGIEAYALTFEADDVLHHSVLSGSQITHGQRDYVLTNRTLTLHSGLFVPDALVFATLQSRSVTLHNALNAQTVRVDFADFPVLLLWQKPGAKYLCIEPWINPPEYTDHDGELRHKPGAHCLSAGAARDYVHTITFA